MRRVVIIAVLVSAPFAAVIAQAPVRSSNPSAADTLRAELLSPSARVSPHDTERVMLAPRAIRMSRFLEVGSALGLVGGLVAAIQVSHLGCDGCRVGGIAHKAWVPLLMVSGAVDGAIVSTLAYGGYRLVRHVRRRPAD